MLKKIKLNVPFSEKDSAKRRGAKWDSEKNLWYIFIDENIPLFAKWIDKKDIEMDSEIASIVLQTELENCIGNMNHANIVGDSNLYLMYKEQYENLTKQIEKLGL
jgi:hypothetical protein